MTRQNRSNWSGPRRGRQPQRSPNSTITASTTRQKSGHLTTPRSCGLQGVAPSAHPYELRFLGCSPILSWRLPPPGQILRVSLWDLGETAHRLRCRIAPDVPRDIEDQSPPRRILTRCLQGATGTRPDPATFAGGQPSWSLRPSSSDPVGTGLVRSPPTRRLGKDRKSVV